MGAHPIVWTILLGLLNALIVGVLVRRVLSVGTGIVRNTIVSLVMGMSIWPITLQAFEMLGIYDHGQLPGPEMSFPAILVFLLIFCWCIVIQMSVLLAIEIVIPSGTVEAIMRSASRLPTWYRRVRRLAQIQRILLRFGLARYLRPRVPTLRVNLREIAQTTAEAFAAAGVTFVKFGQFVATRADMVPHVFVEEFSKLQSNAPPVEFSTLKPELENTWGKSIAEVFADFDEKPLAAASVAQVHCAHLHDGTEVIVKVQRPELRRQVKADSDIVLTLAAQIERRAGWARKMGIRAVAANFVDSLAEELDYRGEAKNTKLLRDSAIKANYSVVSIPRVIEELSDRNVIVMERMPGTPLSARSESLAQLSTLARHDLAEELFMMIARQVLVDGIFHCDLHAGNIVVDPSGRAGLIDFGAVGRIDKRDRRDLAMLLMAFNNEDSRAATQAVIDMLGTPPGIDMRTMQRDIGQIIMHLREHAGYGAVVSRMIDFFLRNGFSMPPAIAQALRALTTLESTLKLLDPSLELTAIARKYSHGVMFDAWQPFSAAKDAQLYAMSTTEILLDLPARTSRVLKHLEDGSLDIGTKGLDLSSIKGLVRSVMDSIVQMVISAALILGGVVMMSADFGPQLAPELKIFTYFGAWVLLSGCTLAAIVLAPSLRGRRHEP